MVQHIHHSPSVQGPCVPLRNACHLPGLKQSYQRVRGGWGSMFTMFGASFLWGIEICIWGSSLNEGSPSHHSCFNTKSISEWLGWFGVAPMDWTPPYVYSYIRCIPTSIYYIEASRSCQLLERFLYHRGFKTHKFDRFSWELVRNIHLKGLTIGKFLFANR